MRNQNPGNVRKRECGIYQHQAPECVGEAQAGHQDVQGNIQHRGGKHVGEQHRLRKELLTSELRSCQCVCRRVCNDNGEDGYRSGNNQAILHCIEEIRFGQEMGICAEGKVVREQGRNLRINLAFCFQ